MLTAVGMTFGCCVNGAEVKSDNGEVVSVEQAENQSSSENTVLAYDSESGVGTAQNLNEVATKDENHPNVIQVKAGQTVNFYLDQTRQSELDILSFDFMAADQNVWGIFHLLNGSAAKNATGKDKYKRWFFISQSQFSNFSGMRTDSMGDNKINTEGGKWYHVDSCVDYVGKMCYFYLDGEFLGIIDLDEDMSISEGFQLIHENRADTYVQLDNVKYYQILKQGDVMDIPDNITYPKEVTSYMKITDENLGSNFFGEKIKANLSVTNPYDKTTEFDIDATLVNDNKIEEETINNKVTLKAGETKEIPLEFTAQGYGFYNIEVKSTDNLKKRVCEVEKKISVSVKSDGINPKVGLCNHYAHSGGAPTMEVDYMYGHGTYELDRKTDMLANAGFSLLREEIHWARFERTPGSFVYPEVHQKNDNALKRNGMSRMVILAFGNEAVIEPGVPVTQEQIAKFAEYAKQCALVTKDMDVCFEVWNEYNHIPFNPNGSVEDYVNMLKATYNAVKSVNPNATVYGMGGITYISNMYEWAEEFLKLGGQNYCDGFSIHPYTPSGTAYDAYDVFNKCNDLFEKYGAGDKKIALSEIGWTTADDNVQAYKTVQFAILINDDVDLTVFYVSQEKTNDNLSEKRFGITKAWDISMTYPEEPYAAKAAFVSMANFNKLMKNAKGREEIKAEDTQVAINKFDAGDGNNILVCWSNGAEKNGTLNLNTNSVTVYDMYGNESKYNVVDNKLDINLGTDPVYVKGNFTEVSYSDKPQVSISTKEINTTVNDQKSFNLRKDFDGEARIEVQAPQNIEVAENNGFDGNSAKVVIKVGSERIKDSAIVVSVYRGEDKVSEYTIPITYSDTVSTNVLGSYFRSGRWQYCITVKNNKEQETVSGSVVITEPESLPTAERVVVFDDINAGGYKKLYINIPTDVMDVKTHFKAKVMLDNGEVYDLEDDIYFSSIVYTSNPPKIDGTIEDGEWFKECKFDLKYKSQVAYISPWTNVDWKGSDDVGGSLYGMYDEKYFYFGAEITDDVLGQSDPKNIWANDSIQYAFAPENTASGKRTEYGFGMLNGEAALERYAYVTVDTDITGMFDKNEGMGEIQLKITRDEERKVTIYESRVPWEQIYGPDFNISSQDSLYFSCIVNENDGDGRKGWIEFCPGIGSSKDPSKFINVPLLKKGRMIGME